MSLLEQHYKPKNCNLCGGKVKLLYLGKGEKCPSGYIYKCMNCGARVSTYPKTPDVAMGLLSNKETGEMRIKVHRLFDKLWKTKYERNQLYEKLAQELEITLEQCHFGLMEMDMLEKVEQILLKWWREKYDI